MLPLDSGRWSSLVAAGGNSLLVPQLIQALRNNPTDRDWGEVWEQISHQWTGYSIAFAAVPHLVHLAIRQGVASTADFLLGLGRTVDSVAELGPPPADLKGPWEDALREMTPIVDRTAITSGLDPEDYVSVLHASAALSAHHGLGTRLFFNLYHGGPEIDCPKCGASLLGDFEDNGLVFRSVNSRMQPLSEKAWVRPRPLGPGPAESDSPSDTFNWLVHLCAAADQGQVLLRIRLLYGKVTCPLCSTEMVVMSEVERG
jgi:hypothetical protein